MSIIVQSERLVSMLTVAQRGHRNQAGVIFSLGGRHVNRWLRAAATVREILGPVRLTHQAFEQRNKRSDVTRSHGLLPPVVLWEASIDPAPPAMQEQIFLYVLSAASSWQWGEHKVRYDEQVVSCDDKLQLKTFLLPIFIDFFHCKIELFLSSTWCVGNI